MLRNAIIVGETGKKNYTQLNSNLDKIRNAIYIRIET